MTFPRLVYMANQIAGFFAAEAKGEAAAATADHIRKFWDPRMRGQILDHLESQGGEGLSPVALAAVRGLAAGSAGKPAKTGQASMETKAAP